MTFSPSVRSVEKENNFIRVENIALVVGGGYG